MTDTAAPNGAPQLVLYGTKDNSIVPQERARPQRPTHLPAFWLYMRRGETEQRLVNGSDIAAQYHTDSFDPDKKWYNHATVFAQGILGQGNAVVVARAKPVDAGPIANVTVCLEVLETKLPDYERMPDGSFKTDPDGDKIPTGTKIATGSYRTRIVFKHNTGSDGDSKFGTDAITPGTLTDTDAVGVSQVVPLFALRDSSFGSDGNLTGLRIYAPNALGTGEKFDSRLLKTTKTYPFRFQLVRQNEVNQSYSVAETLSGAQSFVSTFKPGVKDPATGARLSMSSILPGNYRRKNDTTLPDVDGFVGDVAVFQSNIEMLLKKFKKAEQDYIADATDPDAIQTDFTGADDEDYLFNLLGGTTYSGYPYHTYSLEPSVEGYVPSATGVIPFAGGSDGTMNDAAFAALVETEIAKYASRSSNKLEDAIRVESVFYDTGFPLATKYKLLDFLALRKDTMVMFSTYESGSPVVNSVTDENATAAALWSRAQLYPESTFFGTGPCRVFIMAGSGLVVGSPYIKRVPTLYAVAIACASYMGAGNGKWRPGKSPTGAPGSIIQVMTDLSNTFRPVDQKVLDWQVGLNYAQRFDTQSYHFPSWKTVYGEDTSVLTSLFTVFAIIEINKSCQEVQRYFSGTDNLSNPVFADRVDKRLAAMLEGRFDSRFLLQVETTFTELDIANNYSWTTAVRIGAAGQKTVMQTYVEAYRREVLEARQ